MKYERKPYKIKLGETPIPKGPLDIVHADIFINQPNIFISFMDKFSRFGSLISIKSRSIPDVRRGLIKYFSLYGYPKLLVSDNEPSLKAIEIRGLLNDLNFQQYFIPANHSESNGMVERFHSTVSEIYRCNKHKFQNLSQKEKFLIACTMYNNAIHTSTNLEPREFFYGIKDGTERPLDMDRMIEARNRLYDEAIFKITESQRKQHNWHNKEREDPPILEVDQQIYNKKQGFKSKTREQFENVRVAVDRNQSYEDNSQRKLHKGRMRRVR